jgi:hypothetical protein
MALEVNQRLLFVGLGGTGINATIELENMIRREMCGPDGTFLTRKYPQLELRPFELPKFIQTVLVDTDASSIAKHRNAFQSKNDDIYFNTTTQISDLSVNKAYNAIAEGLRAQMPEDVKGWLPKSDNEPNVAPISAGAGQYPLVGRAALFNALQPNAESFLSNFDDAIKSIAQDGGGLTTLGPDSGVSQDLYIYVAFSVAGGTGTGIYYDILHLLEEKIRRELPSLTTYIFPLVLMPSAFEDSQLENAVRLSKLNGGFAISDLAQLIDQQGSPRDEIEHNFIQTYPGDLKVRIGGIQDKKRVVSNAFLFSKGPNATLNDMYKSIAAFCLSNIGGDLDNENASTQDPLTFFADLINRTELTKPDSSGPGLKPLVPAVGARLSIPVENISNLITSYFVADSIKTASNEALYQNEDRADVINLILKTSKLDFTLNENLIPDGVKFPNPPKKPGSTKEAKELARKVIATYQNLLTDVEARVKTEVSNRLASISVNKILHDVTRQDNEVDIFKIFRSLVGTQTDQGNSVLSSLNAFTNNPEPKDRFRVPPTLTRKNFEQWFTQFDRDIKKNHLPNKWAKALRNDALYQTQVLSSWTVDVNKIRKTILDWNNEQAQLLAQAKVKLDQQGELVKEFIPQVGNLVNIFQSLTAGFEDEPGLVGLNDMERLTKIINSSNNTWNDIWDSASNEVNKIGLKVVDTIEGSIAEMLNVGVRKYFNDEQTSKPLVPNLKTILYKVKNIENNDQIMSSAIDELKLELGGLIGPGGLPRNSKYEASDEATPVVRVTYPADARDDEIEQWIEKQLKQGGALGPVKGLEWEWSVSQGNSIVVAYVIMSHGILGNEDSFESMKLAYQSELSGAGVDKLPWRRRLGKTHSRIIGNEIDERRGLIRLFLSLYTGQGEFHTKNGPVKQLSDFKEIESFVYKHSENAEEMKINMIESLTDTCLPSFSDSLLNYQFEADNASVTRYRYFIGAVENQEVPTWFTQGRPPEPVKAFELLINELKEQEIKTLTKKLESPDLPAGVKNTYKQGLFFWKEQVDSILKSPVVDVNATDGDEMTGFNTIGSLVDYHKS